MPGERLRIGLAASRVDVAIRPRWSRGWQETGADCAAAARAEPWRAAIETLRTLLPGIIASRGGRAAVVLSNQWVRSIVVPWHEDLESPSEIEALARARLEKRFGETGAQWTLRVSSGGWRRPHLACAIDTALLDALRAVLHEHGLRLASAQPLLAAASSVARRALRPGSVLVAVEPDGVCLALRGGSGWLDVAWRRAGGNVLDAVRQQVVAWGCSFAELHDGRCTLSLDVVLAGAGARWPAHPSPLVRLLSGADLASRQSLATLGIAP